MSRPLSDNPSKDALKMREYRKRQKAGQQCFIHTKEKADQIFRVLRKKGNLKILELFAGNGNLTNIYKMFGSVCAYDRILGTGNSYQKILSLAGEGKTYDVIDLDPFGNPKEAFPEVFKLTRHTNDKNNSNVFITICKPDSGHKTPWRSRGYKDCYGNKNPSIQDIKDGISRFALSRDRKVTFLDILDLPSVWRIACEVEKINGRY